MGSAKPERETTDAERMGGWCPNCDHFGCVDPATGKTIDSYACALIQRINAGDAEAAVLHEQYVASSPVCHRCKWASKSWEHFLMCVMQER